MPDPEILSAKSPVSVNGAIKCRADVSEIVVEVISLLGNKGMTVETATMILEKSIEAINKCTLLQTAYEV